MSEVNVTIPNVVDAIAQTNIKSRERRIACIAMIISILTPFAVDSFTPSLPAITRSLHSTENIIQLTITFFLLGSAIGQLFYGPFSDRFGRRKLILIGISIGMIGALLCASAQSAFWLIAMRFVQGAGVGAGNALNRALMRDAFSGSRMARMASFLGIVHTVGWAIAPVVGGYMQEMFHWRGNSLFAACSAAIALIAVWRFLPETNRHLNPSATRWRVVLRNYFTLLTNRAFVGSALCASFTLSGIIAYFTMSPFLLQNVLGLSPVEFGWSAVLLAIGLTIGNLLNATFVIRFGTERMVIIGIMCMLFGGGSLFASGMLHWVHVYSIVLPAFVFSIAGGFIYANVMTHAFQSFPHIAGTGGAIYGCVQMAGATATSLLVATLHNEDQTMLGLILLGLSVAVMIVFQFCIRKR
jgi:DHA1 family 2-module integral membrane pump EmrD-like MFS transporter